MLRRLLSVTLWEIRQTVRNPGRIVHLANPKRISLALNRNRIKIKALRLGDAWDTTDGLEKRKYLNYSDYLEHQRNKLGNIDFDIAKYDVEYRDILNRRLVPLGVDWKGKAVVCLAARIGTEVKSFIDQGAFAVGIDLNPGKDNKYVVVGDFHALQYADASVDVVFSNSMDHAFDMDKILAQAHRVLKSDGILLLEMDKGRDKGKTPGLYESFFWESLESMIELIEKAGFRLEQRHNFSVPWGGEQLLFRRVAG